MSCQRTMGPGPRLNAAVVSLVCVLLFTGATLADGDDAHRGVPPTVVQISTLLADEPVDNDAFGEIVAIDGSLAAVGSRRDGVDGVYVYARDDAHTWHAVKRIEPPVPDPSYDSSFPTSLALQDEVLFVGDTKAAKVWVFRRDQGGTDNWGIAGEVVAPDGHGDSKFGIAVAVDNNTLVVGAQDATFFSGDDGGAYVFERGPGGLDDWTVVRKLSPSIANADRFGRSVAISGDAVAVADPIFSFGGRVFVFERNAGGAGNWGEVQVLSADDGGGNQRFGLGMSLAGRTMVVGARRHNVPFSDAGAVFVYERHAGDTPPWSEVRSITSSFAELSGLFGDSPWIVGDLLFVGNYQNRSGSGYVYSFWRDGGGVDNWGEIERFTPQSIPFAFVPDFGYALAASESYLLVGAPRLEFGILPGPGQAYIYRIDNLPVECDLQTLPLNFGVADTGRTTTATLSMTNTGTGPCTVTSLDMTGDVQFDWAGLPTLPATFDAGQSIDAAVSYMPAVAGEHSASITIASDDADEPDHVVAVSGVGDVRCNVSLEPQLPIVFLETGFGETASRAVTLENFGAADCLVSLFELNACCTTAYSLGPGVPATPFVLSRGAPVTASVVYSPTVSDLETGILNIVSDDTDEPGITLYVRGTGTGGCRLLADDSMIDFGMTEVDQTVSVRFIDFQNEGDEHCISDLQEVIGSSAFVPPPSTLLSIVPNGRFSITIDFTPKRPGQHDANYTITSNDVLESVLELPLTGVALPAPYCDVQLDPAALNFGFVDVGSQLTLPLRVGNAGLSDCSVTAITLAGTSEFSLTGPSTPFSIGVGDAPVELNLTYTPTDDAGDAAFLTIVSTDPVDTAQVVTLSGRDIDSDNDGLPNLLDNCLLAVNANQLDTDGDGFGNLCDQDLNNDCRVNFADLQIFKSMVWTGGDVIADFNGDRVVNLADLAILRAVFFGLPGPSGVTACKP